MKNYLIVFILIIFGGCKEVEIIPKNINKGWIEDIKLIQKELPLRHVNLFFKTSQQEFNSEMESLIVDAPHLEENEIICRLMKIFARIGDSHTGLHSGDNMMKFNIAPVKYELFDDGVYITEILEPCRSYLKRKVTAINNIPIDRIKDSLALIIPHENEFFIKSAVPNMLRLYELLEALNVTNSKNSYNLGFENTDKILIRGSISTEKTASCYSANTSPLYLQNNDRNYWYKIIEDNIVYLQYNTCFDNPDDPFSGFNQRMFAELKKKEIDKFIIDLRLNSGGASWLISPLIEELKKHEELKQKIYVCIGCNTFSSAILNAIQLKKELGATLIGEPTGGKPNHFGDVREMILPNSQLVIRYSTKYLTPSPVNDGNTLEPDHYVKTYSYDSFSGIDSYIEFIKSN